MVWDAGTGRAVATRGVGGEERRCTGSTSFTRGAKGGGLVEDTLRTWDARTGRELGRVP